MIFDNFDPAAAETLLVSIPESAGVLIFGLIFAALAILMRRMLGKNGPDKRDENAGNEA